MIFWVSLIFLAVGVIVAYISPIEYSSQMDLVMAGESSAGGNISFLQNLNFMRGSKSSPSSISPENYEAVVSSTPFLLRLLEKELYFAKMDTVLTVKDYFNKIHSKPFIDIIRSYTIGLPSRLLSKLENEDKISIDTSYWGKDSYQKDSTSNKKINEFSQNELIHLKPNELSAMNAISSRLVVETTDNGIVIMSEMPDPVAAAELTKAVFELLSLYIIESKTRSSQINFEFIQEQTDEAKNDFYKIQSQLAKFQDANKNIITSQVKSEEQKLKADYDIKFALYRSLTEQLENARIELKRSTPVFQIIEPAQVPLKKSSPNRLRIIVIYYVIGVLIGFIFLILTIFTKSRNNLVLLYGENNN